MEQLVLREFHHSLNASFAELNGAEVVGDYGDAAAEHSALLNSAGVIDLSFRGRLCLTGADRVRFLHGQVTNDVKKLRAGEGCYSALTNAKGKMESDLNLFALTDELLLDFEPGLAAKVSARLEKFIVSDDVQIVDAAPHYGLLSVQGPGAAEVVGALGLFPEIPAAALSMAKISDATAGEIYLANHARLNSSGFDLFLPNPWLGAVADKLIAAAKEIGGRAGGWSAFEIARVEAGIPRFGADMDETNLPQECGIENRAVSYHKGCYLGQEVLNRVHSFGHVTRELRGLRLADDLKALPVKGDKLFYQGKEAGMVTSSIRSLALNANIALGLIRREAGEAGTELSLHSPAGGISARVARLPFAG